MAAKPMDPKEVGYYFTLSQVGLEMVAPLGLGLILDHYLPGLAPWGLIGGAVLGFVGGLAHLVILANRQNAPGPPKPPEDAP
jgi:F0F1-type ATP synthase assembly protein I